MASGSKNVDSGAIAKKKLEYSKHFEYFLAGNVQKAKCRYCQPAHIVSRNNGTTNSMKYHLEKNHQNIIDENSGEVETLNEPAEPAKKKILLSDYLVNVDQKKRTFEMYVSRLAAADGIPFARFVTSEVLRDLLRLKFNDRTLPLSANTFRDKVLNCATKIREEIKTGMRSHLSEGGWISVILDEWRSKRNRKYMNVTAVGPGGFHCNLGLSRIVGSASGEKCLEILKSKLRDFDLDLDKDILAIITDGGSNVCKLVRDSLKIHQLCQAHGVNLAIQDVFYPTKASKTVAAGADADNEADESEMSDDDDASLEETFSVEAEVVELDVSDADFGPIVMKLRALICYLRKSTAANDTLQKYALEDAGSRLALILDVQTRWSSLQEMLERAVTLKNAIKKTAIDHKIPQDKILTDYEFKVIEAVSETLLTVRSGMEAMCRRDADLMTADASFQFMTDELKNQSRNNVWSAKLNNTLEKRFMERRTRYSSVYGYLQTGRIASEWDPLEEYSVLPVPRRPEILSSLYTLLFPFQKEDAPVTIALEESPEVSFTMDITPDFTSSQEATEESSAQLSQKKIYQQKLQEYLNKARRPVPATVPVRNRSTLKEALAKEMQDFEAKGILGENLQRALAGLSSIKPTSIASEQAFSTAGQFVTKIRSSLGDDTIDALCFLRAYFQQVPLLS